MSPCRSTSKVSKLSHLILLTIIFGLFVVSQQAIPTIVPDNNLLNAQSNYIMSYFSLQRLTTSSYFQIDFSQSDISVNDGALNVSVNLNGSAVNSSSITSNCTNKVCTIKLGTIVNANTNVQTTFGFLRNPRFTASQRVIVFVFFATNSNQTQTVSLSSSIYLPMPVIVNSVTQSDYGVGSNQVTYTFNLSLTYIPSNPEISIEIPAEVGYTNIDTNLTFYGTYQSITPFLTTNMIILPVQSIQIINPDGFMLLTLYGFRNPRFIGNSNSFNVSMVQKRTSFSNNCVTCRVAYLYLNSSKLLIVSSTTPGDITMNMFTPSSYLVSQNVSLTIGFKVVAPIPDGGKFRFILPAGISPSLPITCQPVYGFTVGNPAFCVYNETTNTIETVNFSIPFLQYTGDAIIKIFITNPKDNRQTYFNFQTLDDQNRKIGKSRTPFLYSAVPLTLNSSILKNNTSIESPFTLSSNITLAQKMDPSTDIIVITLPPSEFYDQTSIQCMIGSNIVSCTKSYENFTNNLLIKFSPVCSTICNALTVVSFKIINLINPSFINDDMSTIQIQTLSNFGTMETYYGDISLKQNDLKITQLNWIGDQLVGSQYQLVVQFQTPRYIKKLGGFMLINFDENSTYLNVILNNVTSYSYPHSVTIMNENNQSLTHTLTYYNTSSIWSLKQIKIKLCTNDSPCASKFTISVLRKSFYPLQSAFMTFKAQTLNAQPISTSTNDVSIFMPKSLVSSLSVNSTISVTNTISTYVMRYKMNKLPFDSGLRIDLSSRHKIQENGRCFVELSLSLGYSIECTILNSTSIILSYSGDLVFMTAFLIDYTITIVNVMNPPFIMPITYKLEPTFKSIKIASYSTSYAIQQPYTLTLDQLSSSNTTYGQPTSLNIKLTPGYFPFDEMKLFVPKENFKTFQSLNATGLDSNSYTVTQNTTFFIIEKIYSLNSTFVLKLFNAFNTNANSKITAQMYVQGYLSAKGLFSLPRISPVFLYTTVSSSNRFVGENAALTFDVRRVNAFNQQQEVKIFFNSTILSLPSNTQLFSTDASNSQLYSYSESVSSWGSNSKLVSLQYFQNMKFIPNNQSLSSLPKLNVSTFDQMGYIVGTTLVDLSDIVPNKIKDSTSYSFIRTNNQSMNNTDLVIDFVPRYPQMAGSIKIQLPLNQNKFINQSSCVIGDSLSSVSCQIVDMQPISMTIQYPVNQTKITLKNVLNQFPSFKNLTLTLMTSKSELIQQSTANITPVIDFDPLILRATANSSSVSSAVQLNITIISPQNMIDTGSKIKLTFPDKIYSRLNFYPLKDCQYEISGTKFTGCTYETDQLNDGKQWIQYVTVSNFTNVQISPGNPLEITFNFVNPLTAYPFQQKSISAILYNSLGQSLSRGSVLLSQVYPTISSFSPVQFSTYSLQQTNKKCSQNNSLTVTITLPSNIAPQTFLYFVIPTVYFSIPTQTGYEIQSQNSSHTIIKRLVNECKTLLAASGLCMKAGDSLTSVIKATNQAYLSILENKPNISIYLYNDNNYVTSSKNLPLNERIPSAIFNTTLQRSTGNVQQNVISTLRFILPDTFNINTPIKISIIPTNSPIEFISSIQTFKFLNSNTAQQTSTGLSLSSSVTGNQVVLSTNYSPSFDVQIQIEGVNPSYAPNVDTQSYYVKIYDEKFIYFISTSNVSSQSKLKPMYDGLLLARSNSQVNTLANYTVSGNLAFSIENAKLIFNKTSTLAVTQSNNFKDFVIGQFLNPLSSNWDTYESLSILNETHILFSNDKVKTTPSLTSLALPSGTVTSVDYNSEMRVNTEQTITIVFGSALSNVGKINIKIPTFFKTVKQCKLNFQTVTSCKLSQFSSSLSLIEISVPTSVSKVSFTVVTQDYQKLISNDIITIETQYPTKSHQELFGLNLWGANIATALMMTSYKVNQQNNIQLKIMPLMKSNSDLVVYLPTYLNYQLQQVKSASNLPSVMKLTQGSTEKSFNLQFSSASNSYYFLHKLQVSQNLILTLENLENPLSNQPFYFIVQQQDSSQPEKIFGHSKVEIKMSKLEKIYVRSSQRNTSKIGVNVQITAQIQIPMTLKQTFLNKVTQQDCIIQLPSVQVTRQPSPAQCQVYMLGQNGNTSLTCSVHPKIQNAIITQCSPGLNKYLIKKGFKNMLYSVIPNVTDKPYVKIGNQYQMAQSDISSTPFLSPIVTSGSLTLKSLTSSSLVRLQKTTLKLDLGLENIQQVEFVNFRFQKQNYLYSTTDLKCTSNGQIIDCWSVQIGSVMVNISSVKSQDLTIQIQGFSNYIRQSNFTIKTLKYVPQNTEMASSQPSNKRLLTEQNLLNVKSAPQTSFGLIDIFYSSPNDVGAPFVSNSYNTRVVFPQNYVSSEQKEIIIFFDDQKLLPLSLSKSSLQFNITTNIQSCQSLNAQFATSLTLKCKFNQSMNFNISVDMFDKSYSDIKLAENYFQTYIYPQLSQTCANQMCNKCSTGSDGIEKCFQCRQNYYEHQNSCIESCPNGYTSYETSMTCEKCSNYCSTCFGLYWNNCLQCQNSTLVSDNGLCTQKCSSGYVQNGYCIGDQECYDQGCRLCGVNGFCYQCLPDYSGEPECQWQQSLPSLFMTFFVAPFVVYALVSTAFFLTTKGALTMSNQVIFAFSLLQFTVWIFIIPALHTKQQAMLILSLVILRVVIGIVAYETYYKKQINSHIGVNEEQSLLEQQKSSHKQQKHEKQSSKQLQGPSHFDEDWKTRLIRFLAHANGIDSYEQFKVLFMEKIRIEHNNLYLWISTANRFLVCFLMFYILSQGKSGDLMIMPLVCILSSLFVISLRLVKSEKFQKIWQKLRNPTK